ncbi:hypothetical protein KHA96_12055 [Bacillus sp. FJAT-49711]|uniref:hypothetical protein n=1 Tax=Bacillus sp. FJAT-49711 TaxID=2833585 RepID=UPI001BCA58C4|nr:hypothetical protein [Bacillus sp. FJAT-49711]MBS4219050.1 hypothetical protein [Bacillus sp. FJAT-49711]
MLYKANDIPIDGGVFWIELSGMNIEIFYNIYENYTLATASYYYWDEDSIVGMETEPIRRSNLTNCLRSSVKGAVNNLFIEMKKQKLSVWHSQSKPEL